MGLLPVISIFGVEGSRILAAIPVPESGAVIYYLDFGLNVREHRFSDNFAPLHERLFRQKLLDHRLSREESSMLRKVVSFPAAPDGNSPEVARLWK